MQSSTNIITDKRAQNSIAKNDDSGYYYCYSNKIWGTILRLIHAQRKTHKENIYA